MQQVVRLVSRGEAPTEQGWNALLAEYHNVLQAKAELDFDANHELIFGVFNHLFNHHRSWIQERMSMICQKVWPIYRWHYPEDSHLVPSLPNIRTLVPQRPTYSVGHAHLFVDLIRMYGRQNLESAIIADGGYNPKAIISFRLSDPAYFAKYGEKYSNDIVVMMYLIKNLSPQEQIEWLLYIMLRSEPHWVRSLTQ